MNPYSEEMKTVAVIVAVVAIAVLLRAGLGSRLGISSPFVVVEGYSMLPTLYNGDIVVIHKPPPTDIKIGDIIVYHSLRGELVIHRVVKIEKGPGCRPLCYITKGDNNPVDDATMGLQPWTGVSYSDVVGVVCQVSLNIDGRRVSAPLRIPYLGLLSFILG
ncbi:hypothetical protein CF15_03820 [Pyrodictium occultum]|uniref:Signal peptidase I n=1 Tax=Pyrodictium occultum TaxID=2309 RepID=A0A0V8RV49_PYROC|nr:hypothetical protein CF15_03820 [Pyrodictium occultum]